MSELRPRSNRSKKISGIARHGRLRKSNAWGPLLTIVGASLAVLLVSGASVAGIAAYQLKSNIKTVTLDSETEGPPPQIGAIEGGFNILIVGSDGRAGQAGIGGSVDDESAVLNDVNILLHVSQDQTNAVAVSIPRDMVVTIPECVNSDTGDTKVTSTEPINVALSYGGSEGGLNCVVQSVEQLTGLPIQFAGMISFVGVINMSDAVGGVDVCVTGPVQDPNTGIDIAAAGTYTLQGIDALAFLRSRAGVGDGSDLTRISSQQVYLSALVRKLKDSATLSDPSKLYKLATAASQNLTLSTGLANLDTMVSIALALKNIPLQRVTFVQYPGTTGGDGVYLGKVQPDSYLGDQLFAKIASDTPFLLAQAGDGRGSEADPNAPVTDPSAAPVDNTGLETLDGLRGQTAADYTCSIANN
ncbi:MAG: LCP family protein [Rhodoglobus sp.]